MNSSPKRSIEQGKNEPNEEILDMFETLLSGWCGRRAWSLTRSRGAGDDPSRARARFSAGRV
jgi:hypothetical protein